MSAWFVVADDPDLDAAEGHTYDQARVSAGPFHSYAEAVNHFGGIEDDRFTIVQRATTEKMTAPTGYTVEWGARWADGGYCPATPPRSEDFAHKHARNFGTRAIYRKVGPWRYAATGELAFPETEETT